MGHWPQIRASVGSLEDSWRCLTLCKVEELGWSERKGGQSLSLAGEALFGHTQRAT